jgi:hypothetical protein
MLMGGLPLLVMLPVTIRGFAREEKRPPGWPSASFSASRAGMVDDLERLAKLHERGALTYDEYAAAKARLL